MFGMPAVLRVFVAVAPADLRKEGPGFDLAIACGLLLATVIAMVLVARRDPAPAVIDPASVREQLELRFDDLADGSLVAVNAANGAEIERLAPGVGGFIRVTMRSFALERKQRGFGNDVPFHLARMANGALYLQDPLTGRTMLLKAFGPSNEGVFAQLLDQERTTR